MKPFGFGEAIGVREKGVNLGRATMFFFALFMSNAVWYILGPAMVTIGSETPRLELFNFPSPFSLLTAILFAFFLAGLAVLYFYLVKVTPLALLLAAISFQPIRILLSLLERISMGLRLRQLFSWWELHTILISALWVFFIFGGMALALRWIRLPGLALLVGSVAGFCVYEVIILIEAFVFQFFKIKEYYLSMKFMFYFLPFNILEAAALGALLWLGVRLTAERLPAEGEPRPRLSKAFYLGTLAASYGLTLFISTMAILLMAFDVWREKSIPQALILLFIVFLIAVYGSVIFLMLVYKIWAAIQSREVRTTPGQAVGFLFVPFYNFYWIFQAFYGLAREYNAFIQRRELRIRRLPEGLFIAYPILTIGTLIPGLGFLCVVVQYVVTLLLASRICDAVNGLPPDLAAE